MADRLKQSTWGFAGSAVASRASSEHTSADKPFDASRAKEKQPAGPKPKGEERRAAAAEEYHRLLQEGAPPGTK